MPELTNHLTLNNGVAMPRIGLGVYKAEENGEVESAIEYAVQNGYRLIDTASMYKNEEGVGRGIESCGLPREELFITTKIWNNAQRIGDITGSFDRSLERLGLEYIDMYLIHWPVKGCFTDTWLELEKIYQDGRVKAIGVSNFSIQNLEELSQVSDIVPAVNQFEFHPYFNQKELLEYCQNTGITVQAYAPLGRGAYLNDPILQQIGANYNKSTAQTGLRWCLQKGISIIPKSTKPERIIENMNIQDFSLTEEEMKTIDDLNQNMRTASIPEDML